MFLTINLSSANFCWLVLCKIFVCICALLINVTTNSRNWSHFFLDCHSMGPGKVGADPAFLKENVYCKFNLINFKFINFSRWLLFVLQLTSTGSLVLIQRDGSTHPALQFPGKDADYFVEVLQRYVAVKQWVAVSQYSESCHIYTRPMTRLSQCN